VTHLLQVPNLDDGVSSSCAEDEAVRVKLGAGQSDAVSVVAAIGDAGNQAPGPDVGKCPVLKKESIVKASKKD
jgi:hypothetical protein